MSAIVNGKWPTKALIVRKWATAHGYGYRLQLPSIEVQQFCRRIMLLQRGKNTAVAGFLIANAGMKRSALFSARSRLDNIFSGNERVVTAGLARSFATKFTEKGTRLRRARKDLIADNSAKSDILAEKKLKLDVTLVYVHPLSQVVLHHFQTACHEWICAKELDQNLTLHRDGTFMLESPAIGDESDSSRCSSLRIWTYYDGEDRKHWLSVSLNQVRHRFLLQDNLLPAWQGHKRCSLPERIQESVQDMIGAVDELEC